MSFIIVVLLSVLGVAVFGFLGMGHAGCIAATASGLATGCLSPRPLGEAGFHIAVYKTFSLALTVGMVMVALLAWWKMRQRRQAVVRMDEYTAHIPTRFFTALRSTNLWRKTTHWLALHEARDPLVPRSGA